MPPHLFWKTLKKRELLITKNLMNDLSLPINCNNRSSIIWRPLLPNLQCIQVPLTEIPSVLDLYIFDTILSRGGRLGEGYEILAKDYKNRRQVREGDVKKIILVDEYAKQLNNPKFAYNGCCEGKCDWKGRISVPQDKSLNLYNIECHGNHDPDHV
ncbi:3960_t:CDS:2 [Gigaspora rosea]|nr:3960_t:CDS:2 [Gigaspora rosea]